MRGMRLEEFVARVRARVPGIVFSLSRGYQGHVELAALEVPRPLRKRGFGTAVMQELITWADANGVFVWLSVAEHDPRTGTTSRNRLYRFYSRFGFVRNRGRHKRFDLSMSAGMYREPVPFEPEEPTPNDILRSVLLSHGGKNVVLPNVEEDAEKIIRRGKIWRFRVYFVKGEQSGCHGNSARLWAKNRGRSVLVTGYALTLDDGTWRQHSWVYDSRMGMIVETTLKRDVYFGFPMTDEEAEEFYDGNA